MKRMTRLVLGLLVVSGVVAASALAAAPQNQTAPSIDGKAMVGQTLTADKGEWSGSPTTFVYQWQRCDNGRISCGDISGATTNKYKLTDADVGNTVRVQVTAKNGDGSTTANSKPTDVVSGNAAPRATTQPTITGKAQVGETLTANPGKWAEGPSTFAYQWQLCDKSGANCKDITGATGQTYGVRSGDKDDTIRVQVTAKNLVGTTTANSDQTGLIAARHHDADAHAHPDARRCRRGDLDHGDLAAESPGISSIQFTPRVITSRTQQITARFKVTETNAGKASPARSSTRSRCLHRRSRARVRFRPTRPAGRRSLPAAEGSAHEGRGTGELLRPCTQGGREPARGCLDPPSRLRGRPPGEVIAPGRPGGSPPGQST